MRILVTGGGTGGHVAPAIAVIQTLQKRGHEGLIDAPVFRYVGSAAGIEARLAEEAGVDFVAVSSGKLRRSSRGIIGLFTFKNFVDLLRIPVGLMQAFEAVRRFKPDVVLATGGYVSVPPVIAASLLQVPILTHEQTVTIGLANRIAGRFATRIALTFEGATADLPATLQRKTIVTGNPVRDVIFRGNRARAVRRFGFLGSDDELPTLYVTGGAQGSTIINRAIEAALPFLLGQCRIVHQCGRQPKAAEQDFDRLAEVASHLANGLRRRYYLTHFVESDEIGDVYALADVVLGRSGAGTVTEACALGKPAVYVPLTPTGGNEQVRNAQRSVDAGAAVILPQAQCDGSHLVTVLAPILSDSVRRRRMGDAARTLSRPNAAEELADALLTLGK